MKRCASDRRAKAETRIAASFAQLLYEYLDRQGLDGARVLGPRPDPAQHFVPMNQWQDWLDALHGEQATTVVLLPEVLVDAVAGLSFLTHFNAISRGVIDLRDLLFFLLTIVFWLLASAVVIDLKKAD